MIDEDLTPTFRKALDDLPYDRLRSELGEPVLETRYMQGPAWRPGDPIPFDVTPAIAQAVGRCVAARQEFGKGAVAGASQVHPGPCGWCEYPVETLLAACSYGTWRSQCVDVEFARWTFRGGRVYARSTGRAGEYDHPDWAAFFLGATPRTAHGIGPSDLTFQRDIRASMIAEAAGRLVS